MPSSQPAPPLRPVADDERESFNRDGAVLLRGVLDPTWVDSLRDGLEAAYAAPDNMSVELAESADAAIRIDQFPAARCDLLAEFLRRSPVAELVGQAMRAPIRFYMDQMFYKPAGELMATAWHQDTPYYNVVGDDLVRAWVSCDATPRAASLEVVRGSHRWNVTYRPLGGSPPTERKTSGIVERQLTDDPQFSYGASARDLSLPPVPDIEGHRGSFEIMGWDYQPGDVILFHGNILHGAGGHVRLDHPRRAHASMWAGPDVAFLRRRGQVIPDPPALEAAAPPDGTLLADLDDIFPTVWAPPTAH